MAKTLTIKSIESARPKEREYKLTVDRGLYIRVSPKGIKTWLIRYVVDEKQRQYTLPKPFGNNGEGYMSLVEAKALNAQVQAIARMGVDYQINIQDIKQQKIEESQQLSAAALTFQELFKVWISDGVNRSDANKYIIQSFRKHALPLLGKIQIRNLAEQDLRGIYRSIIANGKVATAVELSKDIKQMLHWAEKRKPWRALMLDGNPADLVEIKQLLPPDYIKERTRQLSVEEIQKLDHIFDATATAYNNAANKYGVERPLKKEVQLAMWLCLSTLCRIGELLMTEWKHVDFVARTWFIPAVNTKGERGKKRNQLVHLSDFSYRQFKLLHELTGDGLWAFPARYKVGPVCDKSASKQIGDRQTSFKKRTKKLGCRVENNSLVLGDQEWTPHDLRRTGATQMQRLKVHRDVINLCQNHVIGTKVDRVYLLDDYDDEKREAWFKLGNWIDTVLYP